MKDLWTEKYRPATLDDYVFRDEKQKRQCRRWVEDGALPHLMLSGSSGVGKTTLAKVLLNELKVERGDVYRINASEETSVDNIRTNVINFVSTIPMGDYKYVLMDEADYLSPNAQAILRGVMEQYSNSARFILTCNFANRIIPALHSRCQGFHIERLDHNSFIIRIITILDAENVEIDPDILDTYVRVGYPDLRKTINLLQMNVHDGKLTSPDSSEVVAEDDYKSKMVELFKSGKIIDARNLIVSQIKQDEYEDMFRFLYRNLDFWGSDEMTQNMAIIKIRDGLAKHSLCADPEINLSATLTELAELHRTGAQ